MKDPYCVEQTECIDIFCSSDIVNSFYSSCNEEKERKYATCTKMLQR